MSKSKNEINMYLKSEPAGEICAGKLSDNDVSELRKLFINDDSLKDSGLVQEAFGISNLGQTYGVFTGKYGSDVRDMEFNEDNYNVHSTIEIPNKNGIYMVYTGLSKISNEFDFVPKDDEVFDSSKMTFDVTDVNLDMVTDHMYGELNYSVIDGYLYKDEEIDGSTDGYADRGIEREVSIIFVANNEKNVIYHVRNESEETYYPEQLKGFAAYLEKTGDKEWAKKVYEKAEEKPDDEITQLRKKLENDVAEGRQMDAAPVIIKELGDKDWARKIYLKEEKYYTTQYVKGINEQNGEKEDYDKNETELYKLEKLISLAMAVKYELEDIQWGEKLENQTLEESKNLKYRARFVEVEIECRRKYENQKDKIIELIKWLESDEGFQNYNHYQLRGDRSWAKPLSKVSHYKKLIDLCYFYGDGPLDDREDGCVDQSLQETYVQNLLKSPETFDDYLDLMFAYCDGTDGLPQDKTEALKYLNKAKEIGDKDNYPLRIGGAYMQLEMKKEAVAFVKKEMTKIKDKELLKDIKDWLKDPY